VIKKFSALCARSHIDIWALNNYLAATNQLFLLLKNESTPQGHKANVKKTLLKNTFSSKQIHKHHPNYNLRTDTQLTLKYVSFSHPMLHSIELFKTETAP